jgi:hypothetical protein
MYILNIYVHNTKCCVLVSLNGTLFCILKQEQIKSYIKKDNIMKTQPHQLHGFKAFEKYFIRDTCANAGGQNESINF